MNRIVKVGIPFLALAVAASAKPIPAELFGQNIEHTRSALQGGLSAQLVRNRKFAGKPSRAGVAMMWEPYGTHAVYDHTNMSCTRHAAKSRMWRQNERHSQVIGGLADCPVIAVPTSVGYGASLGGVAALLSMLNSCASGVSVVNIDNGFGAGYMASMINHLD